MIRHLRTAAQLLRAGQWRDVWQSGRAFLKSDTQSFGLRRDVTVPFPAPEAAIPITVRPLQPGDVPYLFGTGDRDLSGDAVRERKIRQRMVDSNLATCYVAVTADGQPCYVQWLIGPRENDKIRQIFGDRFPPLAAGEMLLEGAFTLEAWRGKGIMASAMAKIAERALPAGARWGVTFVGAGNIPSLKGCKKAGFEPYLERTDTVRLFRHKSRFAPLPEAETPTKMSASIGAPSLA
jgi:GNAT superfamily N-acetyltransferase